MLTISPTWVAIFSQKRNIDDNIQHQIKPASVAFGHLFDDIFWSPLYHDINTQTKLLLYRAVIIPTLLDMKFGWLWNLDNISEIPKSLGILPSLMSSESPPQQLEGQKNECQCSCSNKYYQHESYVYTAHALIGRTCHKEAWQLVPETGPILPAHQWSPQNKSQKKRTVT